MSIFSNSQYMVEETYDIEPTLEGASEVLYEFSTHTYKLISATYVADIMMESAVTEGATNIDILVEATMNELVRKFIDRLKELKAKMVAWFRKVINKIKSLTVDYKKFISQYKDQIIENFAKMKDVSYHGYDYRELYNILSWTNNSMIYLNTIYEDINKDDSMVTIFDIDERIIEQVKRTGMFNLGITKEPKDLNDLKEKVKIIMTKGSTNDEPVKVTDINAFLNTFENAQGWVKNIEEASKKYEKTINDAMVVIQRKSGFKYITANDVDKCNKCVTMITHISTTGINTIQDALRTYYSTLKKIATFKPAKESAEEIKELFSAAF